LAFRFARWLLAGGTAADLSTDPANPASRRVAANTHPDVFTIERRLNTKTDKMQGEIVIATILEACKFMRLTPAEGGWRVVVVDGAEDMNSNAANALLKVLEEPPPKAILLLVTSAPGRLLPTIRSRCRTLAVNPLADHEMETLLQTYAPELGPAEQSRLIDIAEGSIGTALSLAQTGGITIAGLVDEALAAPVTPARAQNIADTVARATDGVDHYAMFMGLLRGALAARTRAEARKKRSANLAVQVSLWQEFGRMEREVLNLNLDKRAAIIVALSQLHGS